jgi:DNA polymerase elongation subunit (family B)
MKIIEKKSKEEFPEIISKEPNNIAYPRSVSYSVPRKSSRSDFRFSAAPPPVKIDDSDFQEIEEEQVKDYKSGELTDKYKEMEFPEYNIKSVALMTNPDMTEEDEPINEKIDGISYYQTTEKKVLETFWKTIDRYKGCILITFNGRNFDAPFLMLRSAILEVKPLRNLMDGTKFSYYNHIDLADELTFYSPSSYGATKRFNFDFYTRAFGLVSPKSEGIDGSLVSVFYNSGDYQKIAEYCMRDVDATWKLYVRIKDYITIKV